MNIKNTCIDHIRQLIGASAAEASYFSPASGFTSDPVNTYVQK